jgi:hypothetical protein
MQHLGRHSPVRDHEKDIDVAIRTAGEAALNINIQ